MKEESYGPWKCCHNEVSLLLIFIVGYLVNILSCYLEECCKMTVEACSTVWMECINNIEGSSISSTWQLWKHSSWDWKVVVREDNLKVKRDHFLMEVMINWKLGKAQYNTFSEIDKLKVMYKINDLELVARLKKMAPWYLERKYAWYDELQRKEGARKLWIIGSWYSYEDKLESLWIWLPN